MFENYPKFRPELPPAYKAIYEQHYKSNREGATPASFLSQKLESWLHRQVAADLKGALDKSTLELGAGTLNQLNHEDTRPYDIVEPFELLFRNSPHRSKIRKVYADISELPINAAYDRITAVATFEHILNLPEVVARTTFHLNPQGSLRVAIPNEGTWLWKLGYMCTTGIEFLLRYRLNYSVLMRYEHCNNAEEIETVLRHFYKDVRRKCLGISRAHAFYVFLECRNPDRGLADSYLTSIGHKMKV